jgi:hypothetical protein
MSILIRQSSQPAGSYCQWKGMPVMCGPRGLPTGRTMLFHNDGHGKFTDVSTTSGISNQTDAAGSPCSRLFRQ